MLPFPISNSNTRAFKVGQDMYSLNSSFLIACPIFQFEGPPQRRRQTHGSLTVSFAKLSIYFFWHSHICFLDNVGNCHEFHWFTYTLRMAVNGGLIMRTFCYFLFLKSLSFFVFFFFVVTKDQPRGIVYQQLLWHCSMDQKVMRMQLWLVGTEMLFYFL